MITFSLFEVLTLGFLAYMSFAITVFTGMQIYQEYLVRKQTKKFINNLVFTQSNNAGLPVVSAPGPVPTEQVNAGYGLYK